MHKIIALSLAIITTACASPGKQQAPGERAGSVNQPQLLLAHARDVQAKRGCKAAIPAYRVIASFGEGYDFAQFELGACLLSVEGANEVEALLFSREAEFWLTRAAWAGNARAQLKLATALSGAPAAGTEALIPAPADALKWALVYEQNSDRSLYSMKPAPTLMMDHLKAALKSETLIAAQAFADSFTPVKMAAFTPPRRQNGGAGFQRRQQPDGRQRRRR